VHFEELLKKSFPPGKKYVNMTNKVSKPFSKNNMAKGTLGTV
jgi:hypothetical protein